MAATVIFIPALLSGQQSVPMDAAAEGLSARAESPQIAFAT
jgi:hypothetical protein